MKQHLAFAPRRSPIGLVLAVACLASAAFAQEAPAALPPALPVVPAATATTPAAPAAPAPAAPPVVAPAARREEVEGQATVSLGARMKAFFNRDGAAQIQAQILQLTTERDQALQQVQALTAELGTTRADRDRLQASLNEVEAAFNEQSNTVRATAQVIATTVGIPAASLPAPEGQEQTEKPNIAALAKAVREAKTTQERATAHAAWVKANDEA